MKSFDEATIQRLAERIGLEYEHLYDARTPVPGYTDAIARGDAFMSRNPAVMHRLTEIREDCLTSDREVAALGFALETLKEGGNEIAV